MPARVLKKLFDPRLAAGWPGSCFAEDEEALAFPSFALSAATAF
jgi:hypothetical protein